MGTGPREGSGITRRELVRGLAAGAACVALGPLARPARAAEPDGANPVYRVRGIPDDPYTGGPNRHAGVDALIALLAADGLPFYRSLAAAPASGPSGLIAADDVVLVKVNAQWKHRGATNTDVVRGLVQAILDHPDGFGGEVVIFENGQGRGSLRCDTSAAYRGDTGVHANANDPSHSFVYLVREVFADPRVSARLLDGIAGTFIASGDHRTNGYRRRGIVSFPCFTTAGRRRVELRGGVWDGRAHRPNLKLINVPVLKHHAGSQMTGALKHLYGVLSMRDGYHDYRHYRGVGATCGDMVATVRAPVLNVVDAIWVSHASLTGYPPATTTRVNQLLASQDPVALDYVAARDVLYPIDGNPAHHPSDPALRRVLVAARDRINARGGIANADAGIRVGLVTCDEARIRLVDAAPA
jgi:uncharacterized protein (DUF362 family)